MFRFIQKRMGITPEMIGKARAAADRIEAKARELPPVVDRHLLVLLPRDRFFEWTNRWNADLKGSAPQAGTDAERWLHARAYLLPRMETEDALAAFVAAHRGYFLDAVVGGHAPKSRWPWVPAADEFEDWFEVRVVNWGPWDLGGTEIRRIPDEMTAMMGEL